MPHAMTRADLVQERFNGFGFTGEFMTATLRCAQCGQVAYESGKVSDDREEAAKDCMMHVRLSGWAKDGNGVLCPACVKAFQHC